MIQRLLAWYKKRQQEKREEYLQAGYDYAAGELLRATDRNTVAYRLDAESNGAFDYTEFDRGIRMALRDWATTVAAEYSPTPSASIQYKFHG